MPLVPPLSLQLPRLTTKLWVGATEKHSLPQIQCPRVGQRTPPHICNSLGSQAVNI